MTEDQEIALNKMGTPTTLKEAVAQALSKVVRLEDAPALVEARVLDFLSQRFGTAMLKHEEMETELHELFNSIRGTTASGEQLRKT